MASVAEHNVRISVGNKHVGSGSYTEGMLRVYFVDDSDLYQELVTA